MNYNDDNDDGSDNDSHHQMGTCSMFNHQQRRLNGRENRRVERALNLLLLGFQGINPRRQICITDEEFGWDQTYFANKEQRNWLCHLAKSPGCKVLLN